MAEIKTEPRRLVDLNPQWIRNHGTDEVHGVAFDCPCGAKETCPVRGRCLVPTKTCLTGAPVTADSAAMGWTVTGTNFDDLTLSPSVNYRDHWHGHVTNGELTSV
jgi:hypothetical protein